MHLPGFGPKRARAALRRARRSTRSRRCARRPRRARSASSAASARRSRRTCCASLAAERGRRPAPRDPALARAAGRRADRRRAARPPGRRPRRDRRLAAPAGRQRQGHRHHRHRLRPGGADRDARRARRWSSPCTQPGEAGARVVTHSGMKVDLRVVAPDQFGNVLQHFTGSKAHNVQLREAAVRARAARLRVRRSSTTRPARRTRCATEEEVYERLGLPWIPPELREGRGELEAAPKGTLPALIELSDLRGDLHCHTTLSDGRQTLEQMAEAAPRARLRVPRDHRPLGLARLRQPRHARRRCERADRARSRALNERLDGIDGARRHRGQHPPGRLARLPGRAARAARLGDRLRPHVVRDGRGRDDRAHDRRDRAPAGSTRSATRPGARSRPAPPYAIDMTRVIEAAARERHDDRDQLRARPPRHERASTPARPPRPA